MVMSEQQEKDVAGGDNDKPARILSPAEIDQYKATLADFDAAPPGSEEQAGVAYDCTVALCALLAHVDALTPRDVDAEALGREVRRVWIEWAKEQPLPKPSWLVPWEGLSEPDRDVDRRIGTALYVIGYAAGRIEGEAERARLVATLNAEIQNLQAEIVEQGDFRDADRAEIARLTAELATRTTERDEARGWVRRLTATERVLTCAFCGEAYPPGTPESNHERLVAHVKVCAKHPMRDAEKERDAAWLDGALDERAAWSRIVTERGFRWLADMIVRKRGEGSLT
jgi:uncharacterized small protein (DUF1192 family)